MWCNKIDSFINDNFDPKIGDLGMYGVLDIFKKLNFWKFKMNLFELKSGKLVGCGMIGKV